MEIGCGDAVKWSARKTIYDQIESVKARNNLDELAIEVLSDPERIEILERKGPKSLAEMRKWVVDRGLSIS